MLLTPHENIIMKCDASEQKSTNAFFQKFNFGILYVVISWPKKYVDTSTFLPGKKVLVSTYFFPQKDHIS